MSSTLGRPREFADHDQRFKTLLEEFVAEFFELFWPDRARLFDFSQIEWLRQEMFPDPPQGIRRALDLLALLPLREPIGTGTFDRTEKMLAMIHTEVTSSDSVRPLRESMFKRFAMLRLKRDEPILPVAVYMNVGLDGIGVDSYEERFGTFDQLRYNYLYAGLPALDGLEYVAGENLLGVALTALMKVPGEERTTVKAQALKRIVDSGENEYRKFLLSECVQAYLRFDDPSEQQEFDRLMQTEHYQEVRAMATTWFEQGIEQGERRVAKNVIERRFGTLNEDSKRRIAAWPEDRLVELIDRAYQVASAEDLWNGNGEGE